MQKKNEILSKLRYVNEKSIINNPDLFITNIENYIGLAKMPIGLAGPMKINGDLAKGEFYIPLATTEGALVASYNRGMKVSQLTNGIKTKILDEGVQRSPFFKFENIDIACEFTNWILENNSIFEKIVENTSKYAVLKKITSKIEGNSVICIFEYITGDAAGQNMVTICTHEICKYILKNFSHIPIEYYIESNFSGDKKATSQSFLNVRGKKVSAEIFIDEKIIIDVLKTDAKKIENYWKSSTLAIIQSGSIGAQGHVANGLTALYLSCGQDVACISESSVGITRMEIINEKDLYASLTLPSLIVGTVGGGTSLPTQRECLEIIDCYGEGKANKFAEICCALALCGEISIASALSVDHFTQAHINLGRKQIK